MAQTLQERIAAALGTVIDPIAGENVVASGMVRDVGTTLEGKVHVTVLLDASHDATLVRDIRHRIERVAGVTDVKIDVRDPRERRSASPDRQAQRQEPGASDSRSRMLPVMDQRPAAAPRPSVPAPVSYPNLGRIVAVSSGKGGVGKSTVSVNLAVSLAQRGASVGIMDADIYGPDIPRMLGVNHPPPVVEEKIIPLESHG